MTSLNEVITSTSFLEYAFLRWVLTPAVHETAIPYIAAQRKVQVGEHCYAVDYAIEGASVRLAIELDGFEFHRARDIFSYDRLRQNDLEGAGWTVIRFSYDSVRLDTDRCVQQLQSVLANDPMLSKHLKPDPKVEKPDMAPDGFQPGLN